MKCNFCKQELKGWKRTRTDHKGRTYTYIAYGHKNPDYEHVTPFNTMKCYNKKRKNNEVWFL